MTKAEAFVIFRRQINEETADEFQDATLLIYLNLAAIEVAKLIIAIDPEALSTATRQNLVAGQSAYAKPAGYWFAQHVALKSSTDGKYRDADPMPYADARNRDTGSTAVFSMLGRNVYIFPAPPAALVDGLEIVHVATPAWPAALDFETTGIHPGLHLATVLWAKLLLFGETGDDTTHTKEMLNAALANIGDYYHASAPAYFEPIRTGKGY